MNPKGRACPTYWPTNPATIPDLLDFFSENIVRHFLDIIDSAELRSDHSPIIMTLQTL